MKSVTWAKTVLSQAGSDPNAAQGASLGVGVGLGGTVAVDVAVAVAVGVTVDVAVAVAVGVGEPVGSLKAYTLLSAAK